MGAADAKSEAGVRKERDSHPLREAYRLTAHRLIAYSPQLSLKQRPLSAWHLFVIEGKPMCVDMRIAAKSGISVGPPSRSRAERRETGACVGQSDRVVRRSD